MTIPQGSTNQSEELGEEYEVVPTGEFRFHDGSGFCYDMTCPCHEDSELTQTLGEAVQGGLATPTDADRIYHGRTV